MEELTSGPYFCSSRLLDLFPVIRKKGVADLLPEQKPKYPPILVPNKGQIQASSLAYNVITVVFNCHLLRIFHGLSLPLMLQWVCSRQVDRQEQSRDDRPGAGVARQRAPDAQQRANYKPCTITPLSINPGCQRV